MTTKIIAHRGLSGRFPENTHAAFNAAWDSGCDGIELDIQVTKDARVVVIHDPDTLRTSGERYVIKNTRWADLQHINVGIGGKGGGEQFNECIPLLDTVVRQMPSGKLIQIEIKHQIEDMLAVLQVLSILRKDVVIQVISFDPSKLLTVRRALPNLPCFLIVDNDKTPIAEHISFVLDNGLSGIDINYQRMTDVVAQQVLDCQLQLASWTVNDSTIAKQLIARGTHYIASDFADRLLNC